MSHASDTIKPKKLIIITQSTNSLRKQKVFHGSKNTHHFLNLALLGSFDIDHPFSLAYLNFLDSLHFSQPKNKKLNTQNFNPIFPTFSLSHHKAQSCLSHQTIPTLNLSMAKNRKQKHRKQKQKQESATQLKLSQLVFFFHCRSSK
jgi:hypothetical protein